MEGPFAQRQRGRYQQPRSYEHRNPRPQGQGETSRGMTTPNQPQHPSSRPLREHTIEAEEFPADEDRSPRVVTPQRYYRGEEQQRHPQQRQLTKSLGLRTSPSFRSEFSTSSSSRQSSGQPRRYNRSKEESYASYAERAHTESTQGLTNSSSCDDTTRGSLSTPPDMENRRPRTTRLLSSEEQVTVWIGRQQRRPYRHSRWMLTYASPVLKECLTLTDSIAFPHATSTEWEQLISFIEPATKKSLTSVNVPQLLPWFHELDLRALLVEVDAYLLPYCGAVQQPLDVLRLCAISLRVGRLRRTRQAAHAAAAKLLSQTIGDWEIALLVTVSKLLLQSLSEPNKDGNASDEDSSSGDEDANKTASQILKEIKAKHWFETSQAADLFVAYLRFLPSDCIVDQLWASNHSQITRFLQNPVVPYLVRHGMEEKQSKSNKGVWPLFSGNQSISNGDQSAWLDHVWKHLNRPPLVPVAAAPPASPPPRRRLSVRPNTQPPGNRRQQGSPSNRREQGSPNNRWEQESPGNQREQASVTPSTASSRPRTFAC